MRSQRESLRVVIIGAGHFGTKRLSACMDLPHDFTVAGVVDPSETQRRKISQTFGIPTASSIDHFAHQADLAIIATPNVYHASVSVAAMRNGFHVLCEKPLATKAVDALLIVKAAKRYKKLVKTGSNHRFLRTVQKAKSLFDSGIIGKILFFKGAIGTNGERVSRTWFWDPSISGGGTFIDNGCHLLDLARMFMGNFSTCSAHMANVHWSKTPVEDVGSAIFITPKGLQAIITSSWIQWAGYLHIELWGEKGYIVIDSAPHDIVTVGDKDGTCTTYDFSHEPKDSYHRELLYMKHCIETKTKPTPGADDGAAVISMVESAYTSSRKKTWATIKY